MLEGILHQWLQDEVRHHCAGQLVGDGDTHRKAILEAFRPRLSDVEQVYRALRRGKKAKKGPDSKDHQPASRCPRAACTAQWRSQARAPRAMIR